MTSHNTIPILLSTHSTIKSYSKQSSSNSQYKIKFSINTYESINQSTHNQIPVPKDRYTDLSIKPSTLQNTSSNKVPVSNKLCWKILLDIKKYVLYKTSNHHSMSFKYVESKYNLNFCFSFFINISSKWSNLSHTYLMLVCVVHSYLICMKPRWSFPPKWSASRRSLSWIPR